MELKKYSTALGLFIAIMCIVILLDILAIALILVIPILAFIIGICLIIAFFYACYLGITNKYEVCSFCRKR